MNQKPHLIIYSDSHILGGADRYLLSVVPALIQDWQITFIYRKDVDFKLLIDGLKKLGVTCLSEALDGFSVGNILKLKKLFSDQKPTLIAFNQGHFYTSKAARAAAILAKIPHLIIQHGSPFDGKLHASWQNKIFSKITFPKALATIVPSKPSAAFLKEYFPYITETIIINHGIDLNIFDPKKYNQKLIREKLNLPEDSLVITFMSRLLPDKNPQMSLDAFNKIAVANQKIHLLFVGEGDLKNQLQKNITESAIDRVHFIGYTQNPAEILSASDLLVLTSRDESFGLVVIEAMAMGIVPVTFDIGSLSAIIKESGKTVPYGDIEKLSQAIKTIIDNPDIRKDMATKGRERVQKLFTFDRMQEATRKVFQRYLPPAV